MLLLASVVGGCSSVGPSNGVADATNGLDGSREDAGPAVCGNGVVEEGEECDLDELQGRTCADYGMSEGSLSCTQQCGIDVSGCRGCGDGACDAGEDAQTCPEDCAGGQVDVGWGHSCFVNDLGESFCWGLGTDGQLGNGLYEDAIVPQRTLVDDVAIDVSASGVNACAVTDQGILYCWGEKSRVGDPSYDTGAIPRQVPETGETLQVSVGWGGVCAVTNGGSLYCWGTNYMLGTGATQPSDIPVLVDTLSGPVDQVSCGLSHCCALIQGQVWCWGKNFNGQLGVTASEESLLPVQAEVQARVVQVSAGDAHTCVVDENGLVQCWGINIAGQCALPTTAYPVLPPNVIDLGEPAEKVSCAFNHTCAVTASGAAWCWGGGDEYDTYYGQLGHGLRTVSDTPVRVKDLEHVSDISAGEYHTCAVSAGQVYCWGGNGHGALGSDTGGDNSYAPVQVELQ